MRSHRFLILTCLFALISQPAFAPNDRDYYLRKLHEAETQPGWGISWEFHYGLVTDALPEDLRERVKAVFLTDLTLSPGRYRIENYTGAKYRAALGLDFLGETSEAISLAILAGLRSQFPLRQGYYVDLAPDKVEDFARIRVRTQPIIARVVELARHAGDSKGRVAALETLESWHETSPSKEWIDAEDGRILQAAAWCIETWDSEWRKHKKKGDARGAAKRAATALELKKTSERLYRKFLEWWPRAEHNPPQLETEEGEIGATAATPSADADTTSRPSVPFERRPRESLPPPPTVAGPLERIYGAALSDDDAETVEAAVDVLLGIPALTFETLVRLDNLRTGSLIGAEKKAEIGRRLRRELMAYLDDMRRFVQEDPARVVSLAAMESVDPVTACLLFITSTRAQEGPP